jgi:hypothetical protein
MSSQFEATVRLLETSIPNEKCRQLGRQRFEFVLAYIQPLTERFITSRRFAHSYNEIRQRWARSVLDQYKIHNSVGTLHLVQCRHKIRAIDHIKVYAQRMRRINDENRKRIRFSSCNDSIHLSQ